MKRYLYIGIVVIVVVLAGILAYFLLSRLKVSPLNPGQTGSLPEAGTQSNPAANPAPPAAFGPGSTGGNAAAGGSGQKFGVVAQNPVLDYYVDKGNQAFLIQPDGQIVRISGGNATTLSSSAIANLSGASFSYDGSKLLVVFGDAQNPQSSIFDLASKSWQPLPSGILNPTWSPTDYEIAYFAAKNDARILTTLDTANAKAKPVAIATLHIQDATLYWISPARIVLSEKGSAFLNASVWSFDLKTKTIAPLASDKLGLVSLWSGPANRGLIFTTGPSGRNGTLSLYDAAGNPLTGFSFSTLPSKCYFDTIMAVVTPAAATSSNKSQTIAPPAQTTATNFLYCGIPRNSERLAVSELPDAYYKKELLTSDDYSKINLVDGSIAPIFSDASRLLDTSDMKVFNNILFFVNRIDQKLYAISLK